MEQNIFLDHIDYSNMFIFAGGGDTIKMLNQFKCFEKFSYVSTGGGALLEFLSYKTFPIMNLIKE